MSDDWIHLIPIRPDYVPTPGGIQAAIAILAPALGDREPKVVYLKKEDWSPLVSDIVFQVIVRDEIDFVDNGVNLETIRCPHCNEVLPEDWWGTAVDQAGKTKFDNLVVQTPCCGRQVSLNDLVYDWPAGFARFSISILNPVREDTAARVPLTDSITRTRFELIHPDSKTLEHVGEVLGCPVRKIIAHY